MCVQGTSYTSFGADMDHHLDPGVLRVIFEHVARDGAGALAPPQGWADAMKSVRLSCKEGRAALAAATHAHAALYRPGALRDRLTGIKRACTLQHTSHPRHALMLSAAYGDGAQTSERIDALVAELERYLDGEEGRSRTVSFLDRSRSSHGCISRLQTVTNLNVLLDLGCTQGRNAMLIAMEDPRRDNGLSSSRIAEEDGRMTRVSLGPVWQSWFAPRKMYKNAMMFEFAIANQRVACFVPRAKDLLAACAPQHPLHPIARFLMHPLFHCILDVPATTTADADSDSATERTRRATCLSDPAAPWPDGP